MSNDKKADQPSLTAEDCRALALDGGESLEAAMRIVDQRIYQAAKRGRRSSTYHAPHDGWAPEDLLVERLKARGFEVRLDGGTVMVFW